MTRAPSPLLPVRFPRAPAHLRPALPLSVGNPRPASADMVRFLAGPRHGFFGGRALSARAFFAFLLPGGLPRLATSWPHGRRCDAPAASSCCRYWLAVRGLRELVRDVLALLQPTRRPGLHAAEELSEIRCEIAENVSAS